ncbi:electron transport complex subunit RsxD [Candidatus Erwinia haradaeae]|uniref:Ion-translocating oxidoreductase complex subunit D n=1 Tax=Candidatus Erwinia haradaeae TaxID=1922217 RepID=A0A451D776_9GAMM|nr:electron transport complex subunit RsxD [Candidatus Erwinia haradaeae]VFP81709.1 Electron transport complex subunit RsxD [Candidatus Erwinia haradaeae]
MAFRIVSSPYTHNQNRTSRIMLFVLLATLPGIITQYYFFGWGNLIQILISSIIATIAEAVILYLRQYPIIETLKDNSALLTALLLGISIPPLAPWWVITIGTLCAIVIAKHLYGGLGQNPFNPAMVGYVILLISFPVQMTNWLPFKNTHNITGSFIESLDIIFHFDTIYAPSITPKFQLNIDGFSQATPLDSFKTNLHSKHTQEQLLTDSMNKQKMEVNLEYRWINAAFLCGGLFLLITRIIYWQIPAGFIGSLTLFSALGYFYDPEILLPPITHLFSGATMLGAFFIATDPVTASTTNYGRLIYAILIGLMTWLIRSYGGYPDGVAFAVLLANICVPLLDYYTKPRAFGRARKK